jgi:glycine hydroxymethyltransferase
MLEAPQFPALETHDPESVDFPTLTIFGVGRPRRVVAAWLWRSEHRPGAWMSLDHNSSLREADPTVARLIDRELRRQQQGLELIASENFASRAVIDAMGTPLTNKYAEGYPGRRYYGGCEIIDEIEQLAIDRLKQIFHSDHANVQPHSGAQANFAAFMALIPPGEKLMGMALPHGGHLSHGAPVNHTGIGWKAVHYGVNPATGRIDYDAVRSLALREQPRLIIAGGSAYARIIDFAAFRSIAEEIGAFFVVDMAHFAGLVAGGVYPSPVPHAHVVTSTTHKTLRGPRSGLILCTAEHAKAVDKSVFPGHQGGPLQHVIAAKAVAFGEDLTDDFKIYARRVVENAKALAGALMERGFAIVSGGTDSHLMLVDLRPKGLTGKVAEKVLDQAGITVNKNTVPDDPQSPFVTSGIRLGTPALTTRGMGTEEMVRIAQLIDIALAKQDEATLARVKSEVKELTSAFPLYQAKVVAGRVRRSA